MYRHTTAMAAMVAATGRKNTACHIELKRSRRVMARLRSRPSPMLKTTMSTV